ncbi:MAG: PTS sugar transporter subunit IIA [Simkaniaceae bacterium]|nr:PTS sugar transporter subunit IIA [Simkaniaceae bacterium]
MVTAELTSIDKLIDVERITFIKSKTRDEVLKEMVNSNEEFLKALLTREAIVSTGIGMGVAIPHAKLESFDDFFISIGIVKETQGIEWDSLDGFPVRLIFMIGGPPDRQEEYLKILSALTTLIRDDTLRGKLTGAMRVHDVVELINQH